MNVQDHGIRRSALLPAVLLLVSGILQGGIASTLLADLPPISPGRIPSDQMPGPLPEVGFDQNVGAALPLDVSLRDEGGRSVRLGDVFGERPIILAFVYYECPMLCTLVMNGLAKSLAVVPFDAGQQFDVVAVSIDPEETAMMAATAKAETLRRYGRARTSAGWHFLTGDAAEVERLARVAGFRYAYDPETDEYAHASGFLIATPKGEISQVYYGVEYAPKDVRLSLVEASEGRLGSVVDQVMLYCFRYDPKLGKYTAITLRILRLSAAVFAVLLAVFLWVMLRWDRRTSTNPTPNLGTASS